MASRLDFALARGPLRTGERRKRTFRRTWNVTGRLGRYFARGPRRHRGGPSPKFDGKRNPNRIEVTANGFAVPGSSSGARAPRGGIPTRSRVDVRVHHNRTTRHRRIVEFLTTTPTKAPPRTATTGTSTGASKPWFFSKHAWENVSRQFGNVCDSVCDPEPRFPRLYHDELENPL